MATWAEERGRFWPVAPGSAPREAATQNWATALQTYRAALAVYRHVLELKAARARRTNGANDHAHAQPAAGPAEQPPPLGGLTPREREVALLMARGYTNQQIAESLVITPGTAANHVAHVLAKLGLANRTQVAARVARAGRRSY
jgi:DNA-binding NarL/FixJ family response regulator